ncbi:MAG: hypothetical protein TREMPRED_004269 [Tremellales sp. Tagirdzhanova-0007]|nr:MAG: hypothetical protein TREMPRED_004269 [Tremellales sp. Tagirdzhanova-0007]
MSPQAHPPFPSLAGSSGSNTLPPAPSTSAELRGLIRSCNTPRSIHDRLVPLLQEVAEGKSQGGKGMSAKDKAAKGEELLSMADEDLYGLGDEEVQNMTAGLVYVIITQTMEMMFYSSSARLNRRRIQSPNVDLLFALATRLCGICDEGQLEACRNRTGILAWGILRLAQQFNRVRFPSGEPLYSLIGRSSGQGVLSGVHAAFLEACLLVRSYDLAESVINDSFLDVQSATPSYLDVITFHHHAGLICAATRDFGRATDFFCAAVTVPTQAASAVQLACVKRAILCELLVSGKLLHFPKYTSGAVNRIIERNAQAYTKLAKAFEAKDWAAVTALADGTAELHEDCNAGLVRQVVASITKRRILKIKDSYSRLTIDDLAVRVGKAGADGVREVTGVLCDMIATRAIRATMSPISTSGSSIVTFLADDTTYSASPEILSRIAEVNQMAGWLEHQLSSASKQLGINSDYLKKVCLLNLPTYQPVLTLLQSQQASMLEVNGGKGGGKNSKVDELDAMIAAEEDIADRPSRGGVGADQGDMGY